VNEARERIERIGDRFPFPDDAFDRLVQRRDRKRRRERIRAASIAIVLMLTTAGAFLLSYVGSDRRTPVSNDLSIDNVGTLHPVWSADLEGPASARVVEEGSLVYPPALAGDQVFVGTQAGTLYAFPTTCSAPCESSWIATTDGGIMRAPVVADGLVFVATDAGNLYAFPTACSGTCAPRWIGEVGGRWGASPVIANGKVYGVTIETGTLYAFPEQCQTGPGLVCRPEWRVKYWSGDPTNRSSSLSVEGELTPTVSGDQVFAIAQGSSGDLFAFDADSGSIEWRSDIGGGSSYQARPAVTGGKVFAKIGFNRLYAFPQPCGRTEAICEPAWTTGAPFWQPHEDPNDQLLGPTVAADGVVYETCCFGGTGHLFAFSASGDGELLWESTFEGAGAWNDPIVADGTVFVAADGSELAMHSGSLNAFPADCSPSAGVCEPSWRADVSQLAHGDLFTPATPVVGSGVVYVGTTRGDVAGFPVVCGTSPCPPAWTWASPQAGDALSTPAVGEDAIYVVQESGRLIAFAPDGP
jgi:outer membrane protein assembly factor BamB